MAFWPGFDIYKNIFTEFLNAHYVLTVETKPTNDLDLIIYSCFYSSEEEKRFIKTTPIKKLYYSGENDFPDFNVCDYAMSQNRFQFDDRHFYCPLWFRDHLQYDEKGLYIDLPDMTSNDRNLLNREFCSFVVSNNFAAIPLRTKIFNEVSKYKLVASGGKYLNNVGGPVPDKIKFLENYKFNIASENSISNGYITEKIIDAFIAHSIPIYVGPHDVVKDFNPDAFINVNFYTSFDALIDKIKEIDENDDLYMQMMATPKINENSLIMLRTNFMIFMHNVINGPKYNHKYGRTGIMNAQ